MFELNTLSTDQTLETQGVWTSKIVPGAKFKIARLTSEDFQKAFTDEFKPYSESGIEPTKEEKARITNDLTARYILKGWEGVTLDGAELEFNYDNAVLVITKFPELTTKIISFASQYANFKTKRDEEIEKN